MVDIPCIIFAGGKSSRMGEDKSLLPFAGFTTLTEFQHSRLSKIFSSVYISCKDKKKFNFKAQFIQDNKNNKTFAPTLGFISAFEQLKSDAFFAISVDSPFIDLEIINSIVSIDYTSLDAVVAKTKNGMQPLCAIYTRSLETEFQKMLLDNDHRLGKLLKRSKTHYLYFENEGPFLNLNHPHEYEIALKLIKN